MSSENKSKAPSVLRVLLAVLLIAVLVLPLCFVCISSFAVAPVFEDTFVGELGEKYELLHSTEGAKIVVVGGSSVAFGLDSYLMEEHLPMKVVNFGLYANLGTKIMMDLTRSGIGEGDIIVLAPELNSQTLSLYFNPETALQAMDGNFEMLKDIKAENYIELIGQLWGFGSSKLSYTLSGKTPQSKPGYTKDCFNDKGDNVYDRPYNVLTTIKESVTLDFKVDKTDGVTTEYEEFIDYVNEYTRYCRERGATVYFSFPPVNEAFLTEYNTEENIWAFYDNLTSSLECRVISDINDYIMDEGYFFDSEFHLNNSGVTVRTVQLIDDIKREIGIATETVKREDLPEPSGYAPVDFADGDSENLYFKIQTVAAAGNIGIHITGLNEEGMKQAVLYVPNNINGTPVICIDENAFAGASVRTIHLGENIKELSSGAFAGAKSLKAVYVPLSKTLSSPQTTINVPNNSSPTGLAIKDASSKLKIYVPASAFEVYKQDYFWSDYKSVLEPYSE